MLYIESSERSPVYFGQKVLVFGSLTELYRPTVADFQWLNNEARWKITLLWETTETSTVYSSDIGKIWRPLSEAETVLN